MKVALMSDIHANTHAFEKAIEDAKGHGVESFCILGDIVGYGYDPNGCIDMALSLGDNTRFVKGNHDAAVVGELSIDWFSTTARNGVIRHRKQVKGNRLDFLRGLPYTIVDNKNGFVCSHGTLVDPMQFSYMSGIYSCCDNAEEARIMHDAKVLFCGHTHNAFVYDQLIHGFPDRTICNFDEISNGKDEFVIGNGHTLVVNTGSVGYPRMLGKSVYVIYDTESCTVSFRILPFDFEDYIKMLVGSGIQVPGWVDRWHLATTKGDGDGE